MDQLVEILRLLQNLLRFGTIASVDHDAGLCTVRTGALLTRPMPWFVERAGDASTGWDPSIGEQVMVFCPGGDTARGVVHPAIYSNAVPRPAGSATAKVTTFRDGAVFRYDPESHQLTATLPEGGKSHVTASGGITLAGDTRIVGKLSVTDDTDLGATLHVASDVTVDTKLTATIDVTGGGKSVKGHAHPIEGPVTGAPL